MNTYREDHPKRRTAIRRKEDRLLRKQMDTYIKLFNTGQVITSEMNFDALFDVISECSHIKDLPGYMVSGGSKFTMVIPKSN